MDKKDRTLTGLFLIFAALLVGLMYINDEGRSFPVFDGDASQDFQLRFIRYDDEINRGSVSHARLEVLNLGETGSMFVECGIYDRDLPSGSWVGLDTSRTAEVEVFGVEGNCQTNESFVNTAKVYLRKNERVLVDFSMKVPESYGDSVALYCGAFEKCWSEEDPVTHRTDYVVRDLIVKGIVETDLEVDNDEVDVVDEEGIGEELSAFRIWLRENGFWVSLFVILGLAIGTYFVFKERNKPKFNDSLDRYF